MTIQPERLRAAAKGRRSELNHSEGSELLQVCCMQNLVVQ